MANKYPLWWWLIPVFLLSAGLAAPQLNADALWHDEFMAYYRSGGGELEPVTFMETLARTAEDFSWPPGFYLILAQWKHISGGSLYLDRMMQLFTGLLTIAVMYQLGKSLFSERVGLFASVLVATSALFIFYMHELRGHVLYVLSVALCLWSYWLVLHDTELRSHWRQVFFVFSLVLALYAHYVATAGVIAIGLYHLIFERGKPNWNRMTFLGVLALGIYGPWLGVLILSLVRRAVYFEPQVTTITALNVWFYVFFNGMLYVALLPLSLISLRWLQHRSLRYLWFWTIFVILFNLITNIWTDFLFHPRHLLILLIPISLTLGFMLNKIWQWQPLASIGIVTVWVIAGIFYSVTPGFMSVIPTQIPTLPLSEIEELRDISASCTAPDEAVIFRLVETQHEFIYQVPYFYYFNKYGYRLGNLVQMQNIRDGELQSLWNLSYEEKVQRMTDGQVGVWLFSNPEVVSSADIEHFETALANEGFTPCPTIINGTGFEGRYYSSNTSQCERIVTCAGE